MAAITDCLRKVLAPRCGTNEAVGQSAGRGFGGRGELDSDRPLATQAPRRQTSPYRSSARRPYLLGLQRVRGPMSEMRNEISLSFPDGAKRLVRKGITGRELAESIAKSLAKRAVAMLVDGKLADLADPIETDATVKIIA